MSFTEERWTLTAEFDTVAETISAGVYEGGPGEAAEFYAWCRKQAESEWGFLAEEVDEGVEMASETVRVSLSINDPFDEVFRWLLGYTSPKCVTFRRTEARLPHDHPRPARLPGVRQPGRARHPESAHRDHPLDLPERPLLDHREREGTAAVIRHQVILRSGPDPRPGHYGKALLLSCTCAPYTIRSSRGGRPAHEVIEARTLFPAADAKAAWRAWHAEKGVTV